MKYSDCKCLKSHVVTSNFKRIIYHFKVLSPALSKGKGARSHVTIMFNILLSTNNESPFIETTIVSLLFKGNKSEIKCLPTNSSTKSPHVNNGRKPKNKGASTAIFIQSSIGDAAVANIPAVVAAAITLTPVTFLRLRSRSCRPWACSGPAALGQSSKTVARHGRRQSRRCRLPAIAPPSPARASAHRVGLSSWRSLHSRKLFMSEITVEIIQSNVRGHMLTASRIASRTS